MSESYSIEAVLSARDEGFTAGMKAAMDASNSLGNKLKSGLGFGALMAIGNKAVSSISSGISGLIGDMSASSAAWKTFQGNMEMNEHTKKEIRATKKELQEFAELTIYSSSDMASTFAQLDAVGTKHTAKLVKGFGGLAAAAENPQQAMKTLSQQATQAAAKPTIQWMDFKLMLEQTPAGMAAVAKQMGVSTSQLIKNVQDGKVKTEDFFDAIAKVGTNKSFTKLATQYKTVGQAMDGLTETASNKLAPAFDVVSGAAIKGISSVVDSIGKLNGDALAKQMQSLVPKQAINTIKNLGTIAKVVAGGGIKVLGASAKLLRSNINTVIPVAASLLTVFKGYTAAKAAATGVKALTTAYKALDSLEKANAITLVAQNGGLTALQMVVGVFTGKVTLATAATRVFNAACTALGGPVGVAVLAIGALTAGIAAYAMTQDYSATAAEKFAQSCEKNKEKQDELADSIKALKKENEENVESTKTQGKQADILYGQLVKLMKVENKSAGVKERIKSVVKQLNDVMPGLKLAYDAETDSLNKSTSAIKKNISALKEQAMVKAYQSGVESSSKKVAEAEVAYEKAVDKQTEALKKRNDAQKRFNDLKAKYGLNSGNKELAKAGDDLDKYNAALDKADSSVKKANNSLKSANTELNTWTDKFTAQQNYASYLKQLDELAKEAGIKASKIPKSIGQGIKDGVYANPVTGNELKDLIKLDNLVSSDELAKMQGVGMKIPEYLSKGIADGTVSFKDAVNQLQNGIDWTGTIEKARAKGQDVPNSVAEGIRSGQYAVPTSVTAVENLVTFECLKAKAQSGGIQVPEYLANGITSGSMKPVEAAKALGNLMSFQDAINKAGLQGAQIPTELATKIAQGKIAVDSAIKQLTKGFSGGEAEVKASGTKLTDVFLLSIDSGASKGKGKATKVANNTASGFSSGSGKAKSEGAKLGNAYASGVIAGAGKAKSATATISKSAASGWGAGVNTAKTAGQKIGNGFSSSLQSSLKKSSSVASSSSKTAAVKLRSGYSTARSAGAYISQGFASGMQSCLGQIRSAATQMVAAADAAIRAKAKIHSPSRLTKSHGRNIAIGLGLGIRKGIAYVKNASKSLISTVNTTLKKASKTRQYEDLASSAASKYKSSVESKVSKATKSLDKQVSSAIKKLQKKNPKLKKAYTQVGKILKSDISSTIKKQGQKAISAADKALTALGEKYQEKYDKIASDRDNYLSKLSDYGDLFTSDNYGYISLVDFKAQKQQVDQLGKNMAKLKKYLPYDLMKDIQNLDTAQALKYTNTLLSKNGSWLKQYGKDYTAFISSANKNAKSYYQPYIDQLDKDYSSEVTKELNKLKNKMNTIGSQATAGFVKGLTSKSSKKALKKAANDLATILTKSVKGKLKIHSPSRVFAALGKFVGKGFVNGINSMKGKVANVMDSIIAIPNLEHMAIAGNFGEKLSSSYDYYSRAEYTVIVPLEINGKEFARATASDMQEEQNKLQTRRNRKLGRR